MSEDRFRPPSAHVEDPRRGKGSAIKGVLAGWAVDLGGTLLVAVIVSFAYAIAMAVGGRSAQEIGTTLARADADPLLSTLLIGGGVLCSVLGGYVCERIARRANYRLGIVLSILSVGSGFAMGASESSPSMTGLLIFLTFGSVLLGTRLAFHKAAVGVEG